MSTRQWVPPVIRAAVMALVGGLVSEEQQQQALVEKMPRYKSHKVVRAFKIGIIGHSPASGPIVSGTLFPADPKLGLQQGVRVTGEWMERFKPDVGGYYVVYEDGYASYSPAVAFEGGYTLITTEVGSTLARLPAGAKVCRVCGHDAGVHPYGGPCAVEANIRTNTPACGCPAFRS